MIAQLIEEVRGFGVDLWLDGEEVRLKGPLSDCAAQIGALKAHKDEVRDYLRARPSAAPTRSEVPLIDQAADPSFAAAPAGDFRVMVELDRYVGRTDAFDRMIGSSEDHYWNPLDDRYLDLATPFDIATQPVIREEGFLCLRTPTVRAALADPKERVRFINQVALVRFSTLLHGEQGGLNLSASLCGVLRDPGAQEFAANQTREEARHVSGFSRYIKARWGKPAPCVPAMRNFLAELIASTDVSRKIIGLQVMVEGLAMGNLGSLYKRLADPAAKRLVQLVMTDEAFHHKFGRLWADRTMPSLSAAERGRLEEWTTHCVKDFVFRMNPPVELHVLRQEFGLDPLTVAREMQDLAAGSDGLDTATGARETFRVLTNTLLTAGLLSEASRQAYAAYLDLDETSEILTGYEQVIEDGLAYLKAVNAEQREAALA